MKKSNRSMAHAMGAESPLKSLAARHDQDEKRDTVILESGSE